MGQQQLLLVILGVLIVGIAIAAGLSMYDAQQKEEQQKKHPKSQVAVTDEAAVEQTDQSDKEADAFTKLKLGDEMPEILKGTHLQSASTDGFKYRVDIIVNKDQHLVWMWMISCDSYNKVQKIERVW